MSETETSVSSQKTIKPAEQHVSAILHPNAGGKRGGFGASHEGWVPSEEQKAKEEEIRKALES